MIRLPTPPCIKVERVYALPYGAPANTMPYAVPFIVEYKNIFVQDEALPPGSWNIIAEVLIPLGHGVGKQTISVLKVQTAPSIKPQSCCSLASFKYPIYQEFCWCDERGEQAKSMEDHYHGPWVLKPGASFKATARITTGLDKVAQANAVQGPSLVLTVSGNVPASWPIRVVGKVETPEHIWPYDEVGFSAGMGVNGVVGAPFIVLPPNADMSTAAFTVIYKEPYQGSLSASLVDNMETIYPLTASLNSNNGTIQISGVPDVPNDRFLFGKVQLKSGSNVVFEQGVVRTDDLTMITAQAEHVSEITLR